MYHHVLSLNKTNPAAGDITDPGIGLRQLAAPGRRSSEEFPAFAQSGSYFGGGLNTLNKNHRELMGEPNSWQFWTKSNSLACDSYLATVVFLFLDQKSQLLRWKEQLSGQLSQKSRPSSMDATYQELSVVGCPLLFWFRNVLVLGLGFHLWLFLGCWKSRV